MEPVRRAETRLGFSQTTPITLSSSPLPQEGVCALYAAAIPERQRENTREGDRSVSDESREDFPCPMEPGDLCLVKPHGTGRGLPNVYIL